MPRWPRTTCWRSTNRCKTDIRRKFRGLGNVCLKAAEKGAAFRELLLAKARAFLDEKLDHSDPATVFFRARTQAGTAERQLTDAFDFAAPVLVPSGTERPYEMAVLRSRRARTATACKRWPAPPCPKPRWCPAVLADDICFYREQPQVPLAALPQLGGHGREAYMQMGTDHPPARPRRCPVAAARHLTRPAAALRGRPLLRFKDVESTSSSRNRQRAATLPTPCRSRLDGRTLHFARSGSRRW